MATINFIIRGKKSVSYRFVNGRNGLDLVKKIRKTRSKKDLKILILAEEPNSYLTTCFLNEDVNDYLIKEFSRDELYTRVYQNVPNI